MSIIPNPSPKAMATSAEGASNARGVRGHAPPEMFATKNIDLNKNEKTQEIVYAIIDPN